jgi:hypothetical protein
VAWDGGPPIAAPCRDPPKPSGNSVPPAMKRPYSLSVGSRRYLQGLHAVHAKARDHPIRQATLSRPLADRKGLRFEVIGSHSVCQGNSLFSREDTGKSRCRGAGWAISAIEIRLIRWRFPQNSLLGGTGKFLAITGKWNAGSGKRNGSGSTRPENARLAEGGSVRVTSGHRVAPKAMSAMDPKADFVIGHQKVRL